MEHVNLSTDSHRVLMSDADSEAIRRRAARLKGVLDAKGISESECSRRIGKTRSFVGGVIRGATQSPNVEFWQAVARATGATLAYLLDGTLPMFQSETDPEIGRFPSRDGILDSITHLDTALAIRIRTALLADNDHASDPGPVYWAGQVTALFAKYSKRTD